MTETKELITLPDAKDLPALFTQEGKIAALVTRIEEEVKSHAIDVTTPQGRKHATSLAAKVSSSKVLIENAAKAKTDEWRQQTAAVNEVKKDAVSRLEKLRDDTTAPVKAWEEAEASRVREIQQLMLTFDTDKLTALASADEIKALIVRIEDLAVTEEVFQEFSEEAEALKGEALKKYRADLQVAEQREAQARELEELRAEKARRDAEEAERLAKEQAEQEKADREALEKEQAAAREKEQREAQERAQKEAEERVQQQQKEAEERHQRELEVARAREEQAAQRERDRIAREAKAKEEAEAAALADAENRKRIKGQIKDALSKVEPRTVDAMVDAMIDGQIPNVKVTL
ncbi:hypothetical protein KM176_16645 [Pseudooceanicola sp. CBS1P-1]|uniref:DUF1351 domain-containing protein n=1 Tax=Pseudooceanicola albus TaxID=2692189 RepID=A0A6L7G8S3_9RHOB|nr:MULTISPECIES: hypothetical protein [Pseudooceanicola]MBT9385505.1 hypothetical protein [Pseudooceanicola endophyticus]MXN19083.1 hypothetical protein [Pseudooceanicola albus]